MKLQPWKGFSTLALGFSLLLGCSGGNTSPVAPPTPQTDAITLLHFNDLHSHLEAFTPRDQPEQGGVARIKTLVEQSRAAGPTLVLGAGDYFQGTIFFNAWKGSEGVMVLNDLGLDAATLGNHEFDLGPVELGDRLRGAPVEIGGNTYQTESLQAPVVVTNLDVAAEPALAGLIKPSLILEKNGQRYGILGVITETTPNISSPGDRVKFLDYQQSVQAEIDRLEAQGIERFILLSHAGYEVDKKIIPNLSEIDVVISGHDHALLGDPASLPEFMAAQVRGPYPTEVTRSDGGKALLVSAWEWGKVLGRLTVSFDSQGEVVSWQGGPVAVGADIVPDPELSQKIAQYKAPVEEFAGIGIGEAAIDFSNDKTREQETEIGNLVADAVLLYGQRDGAVAAITNGGGIRAPIAAGLVTFGEALEVLPFGNTVTTLEVSGEQLVAALDQGLSWAYDPAAGATRSSGAFPQVAGMNVTYCGDSVAAVHAGQLPVACAGSLREGGVVKALQVAGKPVDLAETYRIATNDFMSRGGDFYLSLQAGCQKNYCQDTGLLMLDALIEVFQDSPVSRDIEGRLVAQ